MVEKTDASFSLTLGMCQVFTEPWAVEDNLRRTLAALDEAAQAGAQLAITPECVLHGYAGNEPKDFQERMWEVAEPLDGARLGRIREKARTLGLEVVVGFAERGEGQQVHNAAALISSQGELVNVYRKVHLRPFEDIRYDGVFTAGDQFSVVERVVAGQTYRVGMMICFDREIPESVRCLRALDAQLIACPLATDTSELSKLANRADNEMITRCRAAENEVFIAVINHAGRFNGGSFVVGPWGEVLHQMGPEAGVKVLSIPVGTVPRQFHSNPQGWMGWGYRRHSVYERYLKG